ncbi:uncharacterized protein [Anabrus simplex]|uniref:uncharacterized protein n=1 Tax=Anabrus simplex TaxID=316456 RepID=UPI0035A37EBE
MNMKRHWILTLCASLAVLASITQAKSVKHTLRLKRALLTDQSEFEKRRVPQTSLNKMSYERWLKRKTNIATEINNCKDKLEEPPNSFIECTTYSGCRATCEDGFRFPSGVPFYMTVCTSGKWQVLDTEDNKIPRCIKDESYPA